MSEKQIRNMGKGSFVIEGYVCMRVCLHCVFTFCVFRLPIGNGCIYFTRIIKHSMYMVVGLYATLWGERKINHRCCHISALKLPVHTVGRACYALSYAHIWTLPRGLQMYGYVSQTPCAVICVYAISVDVSPLCPAERKTKHTCRTWFTNVISIADGKSPVYDQNECLTPLKKLCIITLVQ